MKLDATQQPKQIDLALEPTTIHDIVVHIETPPSTVLLQDSDAINVLELGKSTAVSHEYQNLLRGIYKLSGDELTYCLSAAGNRRPTRFTVLKNSGQTLVKLKRFTTGEAKIEAMLRERGAEIYKDQVE